MTDYQLKIAGAYGTGRAWSTAVHASSSSDLATTLINWAAQVNDFWTNATHGVETLYSTATALTSISAVQLDATFHAVQEVVSPVVLLGTDATNEGPNQDAVLVSLRNIFAGERNRGRMYLPAPAEDTFDEGVLGFAEATRVSTAINALFSGMRGLGYTFFVYNRKTSPRDPVLYAKKTITAEKVDRVLRTQRRRIRKELAIYV